MKNFEYTMVKLVEANPCLYDRKHYDHFNRFIKLSAWKSICSELKRTHGVEYSISQAIGKFKSLRDRFVRIRRKKVEVEKTANFSVLKPNDEAFFRLMNFLNDNVTHRLANTEHRKQKHTSSCTSSEETIDMTVHCDNSQEMSPQKIFIKEEDGFDMISQSEMDRVESIISEEDEYIGGDQSEDGGEASNVITTTENVEGAETESKDNSGLGNCACYQKIMNCHTLSSEKSFPGLSFIESLSLQMKKVPENKQLDLQIEMLQVVRKYQSEA
ncbi:uncharacterized protein LOC136042105 [Artemia franciscana]|uniref:MADF domain-containing protein n=1 Tax=Artemia franciscana TaxID=6661 RepID=A0AA88HSD0_ARTSF|nr:hypothetical protein QYM36_010731 [Artemia franciscana]